VQLAEATTKFHPFDYALLCLTNGFHFSMAILSTRPMFSAMIYLCFLRTES
jgi:hypothetical protein